MVLRGRSTWRPGREILTRIPANRARDVVLFDPSDEERPIG